MELLPEICFTVKQTCIPKLVLLGYKLANFFFKPRKQYLCAREHLRWIEIPSKLDNNNSGL